MAVSYTDQAGRQKILEGLWMIGLDPAMIAVSPDLDGNAFLDQLHAKGVNDDFIRRAMSGVEWRAAEGSTPLSVNVMNLLRASGYRTDEVDRFYNEVVQAGAADDPNLLLQGLTTIFGDRTAGAMMMKATGGKPPQGAVWNPYRTDAPPKTADTRYGGGGIPATLGTQDLAAGPAGTRAAQLGQLPTPPTPVAQAQAAAKAPAVPAGTAPTGLAPTVPTGPGAGGGPNNQPTIDNPANWDDEKVRTWLKQNLGSDAWFIDIPDVWDVLRGAVRAGKGLTGADEAFKATSFYQHSSASARLWYRKEREDPASAASDVAQQTQAINNAAQAAGISLDPERAQQMAQSYLRYGWTATDLQRAIGAEWHYDPSTRNQAAAVTKMKSDARNWLVPLSDQAIQTWGQGLISGTVTQEQYTQYLRDNAKSLMPQLANLIDQHAGDANFTVSTFADPYKQHAANLLGVQPDQIDLNDSRWRQALDTVDPKTGERRIMSLSEWESKVKTDPTFGYDKTANGINDGLALAQSLKQSMGF